MHDRDRWEHRNQEWLPCGNWEKHGPHAGWEALEYVKCLGVWDSYYFRLVAGGDVLQLHFCPGCGAPVRTDDRETHVVWHQDLAETARSASTADAMWRPIG